MKGGFQEYLHDDKRLREPRKALAACKKEMRFPRYTLIDSLLSECARHILVNNNLEKLYQINTQISQLRNEIEFTFILIFIIENN